MFLIMSEKKHIILVNFDFPPNEGIGGRRWAKFARYLGDQGVKVHVIKAKELPGRPPSVWSKDVEHENISITSLDRPLPQYFTHPGKGLWDKIRFHLYKRALRKRSLGTIYDQAIDWEAPLHAALEQLVKAHPVSTIIASGAPFNLLYYTANFVASHPEIQFIADYRDPWISARNYGMPELNEAQLAHEIEKQNRVLEVADIISSPYEKLSLLIKEEGKGKPVKAQFIELGHCFDQEQLPTLVKVQEDKGFTFVYGGALYQGIERYFDQLSELLDTLKVEDRALYERVHFKVYSSDFERLQGRYSKHNQLKFLAPIGSKLFTEIDRSSAAIIALSEHNKDFKTTKFYEFLSRKKPIFYLGPKGDVAQFLERKNLGSAVQTVDELKAFIERKDWEQMDLSEHELKHRGANLLSYLR
jgi:hypothetical protein